MEKHAEVRFIRHEGQLEPLPDVYCSSPVVNERPKEVDEDLLQDNPREGGLLNYEVSLEPSADFSSLVDQMLMN